MDADLQKKISLKRIRENIYTFEKFTKEQWESIERPVDDYTRELLKLLVTTASNKSNETNINPQLAKIKVCGELAYTTLIRPILIENNYLVEQCSETLETETKGVKNNKKKQKQKPLKKDDQFRLANFKRIVDRSTKELFQHFTTVLETQGCQSTEYKFGSLFEQAVTVGLNNDILELRIVTLIVMAHLIKEHLRFDNARHDREPGYRLIQSIQLVLENMGRQKFTSVLDSTTKIEAASSLICDLDQINQQLKNLLEYNVETIFTEFPHLISPNSYHHVLSQFSLKLNSCQQELIDITSQKQAFLVCYSSNFGSGKTTSTIGIAATKLSVRDHLTIYCCMSEAVRHNLAKYAYSSQIPFALAVNINNRIRIINNNNCRDDRARRLIITDYLTAYDLLNNMKELLPNQTSTNTTLIVDEPTDGADQELHYKTTIFAHLFTCCPSRTILVSATLPTQTALQPYFNYFNEKWGNLEPYYGTVCSNKVRIGCHLIERDGTNFSLHSVCDNTSTLERLINLLKTNQFLGRLYTAPVVYHLHRKLKETGFNDLPNLEEQFRETSQLNTENIKTTAIILLEQLLQTGNSELIKEICQERVSAHPRYDLYGQANAKKIHFDFDFQKLGTTDAYKFLGPTLLVSKTPEKAIDEYYESLLEGINGEKLISGYLKNKDSEEKAFKKLEKTLASYKPKKDEAFDQMEKEKRLEELTESFEGDISFPLFKQINTYRHLKYYTQCTGNLVETDGYLDLDCINGKKLRATTILTNLPYQANVSRDLILRLFSGVGLLTERDIDPSYNNEIVTQTLEGTLAYTVSDETIIFGVNAPADNLIIEDSAIENRSISTIFQLLARVGRPGLSTTAYAFIGPVLRNILVGLVTEGRKGIRPIDNEAGNMNLALSTVLSSSVYQRRKQLEIEQQNELELKREREIQKEHSSKMNANINENKSEETEIPDNWEDDLSSDTTLSPVISNLNPPIVEISQLDDQSSIPDTTKVSNLDSIRVVNFKETRKVQDSEFAPPVGLDLVKISNNDNGYDDIFNTTEKKKGKPLRQKMFANINQKQKSDELERLIQETATEETKTSKPFWQLPRTQTKQEKGNTTQSQNKFTFPISRNQMGQTQVSRDQWSSSVSGESIPVPATIFSREKMGSIIEKRSNVYVPPNLRQNSNENRNEDNNSFLNFRK